MLAWFVFLLFIWLTWHVIHVLITIITITNRNSSIQGKIVVRRLFSHVHLLMCLFVLDVMSSHGINKCSGLIVHTPHTLLSALGKTSLWNYLVVLMQWTHIICSCRSSCTGKLSVTLVINVVCELQGHLHPRRRLTPAGVHVLLSITAKSNDVHVKLRDNTAQIVFICGMNTMGKLLVHCKSYLTWLW